MWGIDWPRSRSGASPSSDPAPAVDAPIWDLAVSAPTGAGQADCPDLGRGRLAGALGRTPPWTAGRACRARRRGRWPSRSPRSTTPSPPRRSPRSPSRRSPPRRPSRTSRRPRRRSRRWRRCWRAPPATRRPMMSLDATTIMPPLSLLPPLPSSRGRGRPPVPMSPSRSSARSRAPKPTTPARPTPEATSPRPAAARPRLPAETPRVDAGLFDDRRRSRRPSQACPPGRRWSRPPPSRRRRASWPR